MAGKHSKSGSGSVGRTVLIVLIALAVIAAAAAVLAWAFMARPAEVEEISGQEAILAAGDAPQEIRAPEEEPVEQEPAPEEETSEAAEKDLPDEIQAPAEEPVEEEPEIETEIPGGEAAMVTMPRPEFAEIYDEAGIQPVYQMAEYEGEGYAVLARGNRFTGISQYEFVYDGQDRVIAMAETHYAFYDGATPEELQTDARNIAAGSQPPEEMENVSVTCEAADGYTILRIRMEGMDDPQVVEKLSEIAFIPYTAEEYLYFTQTRDNLVDTIGYAQR